MPSPRVKSVSRTLFSYWLGAGMVADRSTNVAQLVLKVKKPSEGEAVFIEPQRYYLWSRVRRTCQNGIYSTCSAVQAL